MLPRRPLRSGVMQRRPSVHRLAVVVALVATCSGATLARPAPRGCAALIDATGDESDPYQAGGEARLDLTRLSAAVTGDSLRLTLGVRSLAAPAVPQSTGSRWAVRFAYGSLTYEAAANDDLQGRTFVVRLLDDESAGGPPLPGGDTPISGSLDAATSSVVLDIPRSLTTGLRQMKPRAQLSGVDVTSARWTGTWATGGAYTLADEASAEHLTVC